MSDGAGTNERLRRIIEGCEGALAAVLIGDGATELATSGSPSLLDGERLASESALLVSEILKVSEILEFGRLRELVISSARLTFVVRALAPERFLGLAIGPNGNVAKARFIARTAWRQLAAT